MNSHNCWKAGLAATSLLFSACKEPASVAASREIPLPAKLCNAEPIELAVRPANYAELERKFDPPVVVLRRGDVAIPLKAKWDKIGYRLLFISPVGAPRGEYSLSLSNQGQSAAAVLLGNVRVVSAPVITDVISGLWCVDGAVASELSFRVENLEVDTTVVLDGTQLGTTAPKVERLVEHDTLNMQVLGGEFALGSSFDLVATNAPGCSARHRDAVEVVTPPKPQTFTVAPTLADGITVPPAIPFTVRIGGESISGRTALTVGGVSPLHSYESDKNGELIAEFAPLPPGIHTLQANNGGCHVDVPGHISVASDLPVVIAGLNPNTISMYGNHYLDVTVQTPSELANKELRFFVDINPDPIVADWRQLPSLAQIAPFVHRVISPSVSMSKTSALDVRVEVEGMPGQQGFWGGQLIATVEAADLAPRLVVKDKDHVKPGERLVVYGCFAEDVQASLVPMNEVLGDTSVGETPVLIRSLLPAEVWARERFRCRHDLAASVTKMMEIEVPANQQPGAYRLRLSSVLDQVRSVADDTYPLMVYSNSPTLHGFEVGRGELSTRRKMPSTVVATDGSGRKFAYVIGGDAVVASPASDPRLVQAPSSSYDFATVSPWHELLGFRSANLESDGSLPVDVSAVYGSLALSDGPNVILVGGTADGSTAGSSSEVRVARVGEALSDGAGTISGKLTAFRLAGQLGTSSSTIKSYGAQGAVLRSGAIGAFVRHIVIVRGAESSENSFADVNAALWAPLGNLAFIAPAGGNALSRSFAAATASVDQLHTYLGFVAGDAPASTPIASTANRMHSLSAWQSNGNGLTHQVAPLSGPFAASAEQAIRMALPELGTLVARLGGRTFIVGGLSIAHSETIADGALAVNEELNLSDAAQPRDRVLIGDDAAVGVAANLLQSRRAHAGGILLPPHWYAVGGIVCSSDEDANGTRGQCNVAARRRVSKTIEHAEIH